MTRKSWKKNLLAWFSKLAEGPVKRGLRATAMSIWPVIPKRFLINWGDNVLQVGTPSPETIRHYLEIVGPGGRIVVVEPEESNYRRLSDDPVLAAAANVTIVQRAAWSERGMLELVVSKSAVDHKIAVPGIVHDNDLVPDNYRGVQSVLADTVDGILNELNVPHIDYAEIHVNGAEIEVLRGMSHSLENTSRLHIKGHARFEETGEAINERIVEFLNARGFTSKIGVCTKAREEAAGTASWHSRAGDVLAVRRARSRLGPSPVLEAERCPC